MKKIFLLLALSHTLATTAMASISSNSDEMPKIERTAHIPSAAEFDGIVESILSSKNLKFADLEVQKKIIMENYNTPYNERQDRVLNTTALGDILNHPKIMAYLMRPTSHLMIRDGIAVTDSQYENSIYGLLEYEVVLWRKNIGKKEFYESPSEPLYVARNMPLKATSEDVGLLSAIDTYPGKIYETRYALYYWEMQEIMSENKKTPKFKGEPRFVVTPNATEGHATTLVHVLEGRRVMLTLSLNTEPEDLTVENTYGKEVMKKFNLQSHYTFFLNPATFYQLTPSQLQEKGVSIHEQFNWIARINRTTPYINMSHNIQVGAEDQNCVMYANNFSNAIVQMLSEKSMADEAYNLAKKFASNPADTESKNFLGEIFQNKLKRFLPQYYNADGSVKSAAELKKYHIDLRWDISSKSIQEFVQRLTAVKNS